MLTGAMLLQSLKDVVMCISCQEVTLIQAVLAGLSGWQPSLQCCMMTVKRQALQISQIGSTALVNRQVSDTESGSRSIDLITVWLLFD